MQEIWPLLQSSMVKHTGLKYRSYDPGWKQVYNTDNMRGRIKDVQLWKTFPSPERRSPGEGFRMADIEPTWNKRYIRVYYGLGTLIAKEDWDTDQTGVLAKVIPTKAGALAEAHYTLMEQVCADWFRLLAFASAGNNTPGMSDGRPYFDLSHPAAPNNLNTLYANRPSVLVDLSVASYQAGATNLRKQKAANGTKVINNSPANLVVAPDQLYIGQQILKSEMEPGTANRNQNFIPKDAVKLTVWPYWNVQGTSGAANGIVNGWALLGQDHSLTMYTGDDVEVESQYELGMRSMLYISTCSFTVGADDWRGGYGSPGS